MHVELFYALIRVLQVVNGFKPFQMGSTSNPRAPYKFLLRNKWVFKRPIKPLYNKPRSSPFIKHLLKDFTKVLQSTNWGYFSIFSSIQTPEAPVKRVLQRCSGWLMVLKRCFFKPLGLLETVRRFYTEHLRFLYEEILLIKQSIRVLLFFFFLN